MKNILRKIPGWPTLKLIKIKAKPDKIRDEVSCQRLALKGNASFPKKKFILFSHGRSGSELLRNLLNSHPDIYCDVEIFIGRSALFARCYLDNRSKLCEKKVYGYKASSSQLDDQYLKKNKVKKKFFTSDYQVIFLRRVNILQQALSVMVARKRQVWHDTEEGLLKDEKFFIDCDELLRIMQWKERCEKREEELLEDVDYLPIRYETDLLNESMHQQTLNRIFDFLDIRHVPVQTIFFKSVPEKMIDFIDNYDEVVTMIRETEYSHYLDDA